MRAYAALFALLLGAPALADEPKVAGTDVPAPKRTKFVLPEYPAEAVARGLHGIVILEITIDEQGKVADARVVRSVPPFDEAAIAAVRQWEYEPTTVDAAPVRVRLAVPLTFALKQPEVTRSGSTPAEVEAAPAVSTSAELPTPPTPSAAAPAASVPPRQTATVKAAKPPAPIPPAPPIEVISTRPPASAAVAPEAGISTIRDVTLGEQIPELAKGRRPLVPPFARIHEQLGSAEVEFFVESSGVTSLDRASGPDLLKDASAQTVASWVFRRSSLERLHLVAVFNYEMERASARVERAR